jgi:hypothetical protein
VIAAALTLWGGALNINLPLGALKAMRAVRAMRPLRMMHRFPGVRIVVETMIGSLPDVVNVMAVCVIIFLIFAIFAVNFLKGLFRDCSGETADVLGFGDRSSPYGQFLADPQPWAAMDNATRAWFGPDSVVTHALGTASERATTTETTECGGGVGSSGPCCSEWAALPEGAVPTSRQVCECWIEGGAALAWGPFMAQRFDNVAMALLTFFECSTTEGWIDIMFGAVDSRGVDMQPVRDANRWWVVFFIFFMLIGSYFVLNLFIGVILNNFYQKSLRVSDEDQFGGSGSAFVTAEQREWVKSTESTLRAVRLVRLAQSAATPPGSIRAPLHLLVTSRRFEHVTLGLVAANTVLMGCAHYAEPDWLTLWSQRANLGFALAFSVEALLKLYALRWEYFGLTLNGEFHPNQWNLFDLAIVVGTDVGLVVKALTGDDGIGSLGLVVRACRIGRVFRLMQSAKGMAQVFDTRDDAMHDECLPSPLRDVTVKRMAQVFDTLVSSLPGMLNVGALLLLLSFIYAAVGVQLFSKIAFYGAHDEHCNYRTFWAAMSSLLRFATGENFNGFMHDMAHSEPKCDDDPHFNAHVCGFGSEYASIGGERARCRALEGCGSQLAFPFFISYQLLVPFVFINLFIGVILEGFSTSQDVDKASNIIQPEDMRALWTYWSQVDLNDTHTLSLNQFRLFLNKLPPPWMPVDSDVAKWSDKLLMEFCGSMRLRIWTTDKPEASSPPAGDRADSTARGVGGEMSGGSGAERRRRRSRSRSADDDEEEEDGYKVR